MKRKRINFKTKDTIDENFILNDNNNNNNTTYVIKQFMKDNLLFNRNNDDGGGDRSIIFSNNTCNVDYCDKLIHVKKYKLCKAHYEKRNNKLTTINYICCIKKCKLSIKRRHLCYKHYKLYLKNDNNIVEQLNLYLKKINLSKDENKKSKNNIHLFK